MRCLFAVLALGLSAAAQAVCAVEIGQVAVAANTRVSIEYTLTVDGSVVDSTEGKAPFQYVQGKGQIVPGLEKALEGLKAGEAKEVTVFPDEGYGTVDPAAFVEVAKSQLPEGVAAETGMVLQGTNPDGQSFRAIIAAVKADSVTLNLNHPLAGKILNFKVKVLSVNPA